jgi:hypothetical protein
MGARKTPRVPNTPHGEALRAVRHERFHQPKKLQEKVARCWTVWDLIEKPARDRREFYIDHYLNSVCLLTARELKNLFPGGQLLRERHLCFTKSLIVARTASYCGPVYAGVRIKPE